MILDALFPDANNQSVTPVSTANRSKRKIEGQRKPKLGL